MLLGFAYLYVVDKGARSPVDSLYQRGLKPFVTGNNSSVTELKRKPPVLIPQQDQTGKKGAISVEGDAAQTLLENKVEKSKSLQSDAEWTKRQAEIVGAFKHAWKGYKAHAMGSDELQPLSKKGVDSLGGLGATIVDALDTAMIMNLGGIVKEAGSWVERELPKRFSEKGQVNLFETTIRVLGGLLSAYQLSSGSTPNGGPSTWGAKGDAHLQGPEPKAYLERAIDLADRLMSAFTSSPSAIPYSDVVLRGRSAHAAVGDGASSTAEVATLQLEFGYLSQVSNDSRYSKAAMHVYEHLQGLQKLEGLVPIYVR